MLCTFKIKIMSVIRYLYIKNTSLNSYHYFFRVIATIVNSLSSKLPDEDEAICYSKI